MVFIQIQRVLGSVLSFVTVCTTVVYACVFQSHVMAEGNFQVVSYMNCFYIDTELLCISFGLLVGLILTIKLVFRVKEY